MKIEVKWGNVRKMTNNKLEKVIDKYITNQLYKQFKTELPSVDNGTYPCRCYKFLGPISYQYTYNTNHQNGLSGIFLICPYCKGTGVIDWISYITNGKCKRIETEHNYKELMIHFMDKIENGFIPVLDLFNPIAYSNNSYRNSSDTNWIFDNCVPNKIARKVK
jgi:hypothetical protein